VVRRLTDRKAVKPVLPRGLDAVSVRATPGDFHSRNGKAEYTNLDLVTSGVSDRRRG
jgi:hypothetical protein